MPNFQEGKSGVNVKQLVQNIAESYSFEPQIAALIELIANSLDAGASEIKIIRDSKRGVLEVVDNGLGMDRRQFKEYHDFATTTKTRGSGIGFAGQGAKLGLNFCDKVETETWSATYKGLSEWYIKGNDAPYKIHHLSISSLDNFGTRVLLFLDKNNKDFYTDEIIIDTLFTHYYPLIDPFLNKIYTQLHYKNGLKIYFNGKLVVEDTSLRDRLDNAKDWVIRFYNLPQAKGFVGKIKGSYEKVQPGIMICTYGKVIETTFLKKEPKDKNEIFGWIEAPYLIEAVTTDKCRFQRGNKTWEGFLRKAQKDFDDWLQEVGLSEKLQKQSIGLQELEKEINKILKNMPELPVFRSPYQRDVMISDALGEGKKLAEGVQKTSGTLGGTSGGDGVVVSPGEESGKAPSNEPGTDVSASPKPRTIRSGVKIIQVERPELEKEAWFEGETVYINKCHPAHLRSEKEKIQNYHWVKCISQSLIEFSIDRDPEPNLKKPFELSQKFFKLWGEQA